MRKTASRTFGLQPFFVVEGVAGVRVGPFVADGESHVGDGQPHLQEHLLIECLHLGNFIADGIHPFEGALPPIIPRGLFSLYDFARAKSRVRPGACWRL